MTDNSTTTLRREEAEAALGKAMLDSIIQERAARAMPPASEGEKIDPMQALRAKQMLALLRAMKRGATVGDLCTLVPGLLTRDRRSLCGEIINLGLATRSRRANIEVYDLTDAGRAFVEGKA